ncbi:MAG: serine protease [Halioglobus sp.]|nr:serine protease [Halioglobus sp.]
MAADLADVIDKVRPSVVGIGATYPKRQPNRRGDPIIYAGTGFVVGNGRQVITNYHVLPQNLDTRNRQQLTVFSGRGAYVINHRARVVRVDEERDLALLEFDGTPLPALELGDSSRVREGQEIAFTGFPLGTVLGLFPATHRGIVSAITPIARALENARDLTPAQLRRMRNPYLVFQLDAVAYPGNSGSPLFETDSGKVIGVINAVIVKRSRESAISYPSGISFAIPSHFIEKLLKPAP